ncbi:MAG: type II toxin-antitoxin system RelE/ParE family toxin [Gaiellaceae bacterium]
MAYEVEVWEAAKADLVALGDREAQLAALRVALALRDDPLLGAPLRDRAGVGNLSGCRRVSFDRPDWTGKPRYRLVYRDDPADGSIAVVQVIAVGLREQLAAYWAAAARLRAELRRRLT